MNAAPEEAAVLHRLALQDLRAFRVLQANADIGVRIVCFHGQQAVEKLLKAVLVTEGVVFPPTHDLTRLAELLSGHGIVLPVEPEILRRLNPYAVVFRYDDREIHTLSRDEAREIVDRVFAWAATWFGEPAS